MLGRQLRAVGTLFACLLMAGLVVVQAQVVVAGFRGAAEQTRDQLDFAAQFTAARLIAVGRGQQLYDLNAQRDAQHQFYSAADDPNGMATYVLPPPLALLLVPLAPLPFAQALAVFDLLNLALLVGVASVLLAHARLRAQQAALLLLAALSYHPVWLTLLQGQTGLLVLGIWAAALAAFRAGKLGLGGACIGLLAFKPPLLVVPALAVLLIWRSYPRAVLGMLGSAAALLLLSVLLLGPEGITGGLRVTSERAQWTAASLTGPGAGWAGQFERWLGAGSPWLWPAALVGTTIASLLAAWRLALKPSLAAPVTFSVVFVLAFVGAPYVYSYDQAALALPGLLLAIATIRAPRVRRRTALQALLIAGYLAAWLTPIPAALPQLWDLNVLVLTALVACALTWDVPWRQSGDAAPAAQVPSDEPSGERACCGRNG